MSGRGADVGTAYRSSHGYGSTRGVQIESRVRIEGRGTDRGAGWRIRVILHQLEEDETRGSRYDMTVQ